MKAERVKELIEELKLLHRQFESTFPRLYEEGNTDTMYELVKRLYSTVGEKMGILSEVYREMAPLGEEVEGVIMEVQRVEHQMKFRLEELMGVLSKPLSYSERPKLKILLDRLTHFHRIYDYTVTRAIQTLTKEAEGLEFIEMMDIKGENQKKPPTSIIRKLEQIDDLEKKLESLIRFTYRLYAHPADVHKVEDALKAWHRMGLLWVEERNVEKLSGVKNAGEILEGLTLIGVVERKKRGGESVYRHRSFS
ncbi:hypothetical protein [Thermococcus gorgonarius]|uniref:Uncharacterized protein n=1 Tax=Thermococcus gorgonarius TaxID=71997 RepID=A0A2Z2MBU6_THEGO|nr:hypothetical protein [Thermococcus gorgonarius]ASJ00031.1 hypothetical protein A3K92_00290 [Thermococcus gorgonarius]